MRVYPHKSQFGWDGDNGLGDRLIQKIICGHKTATAGPKDLYTLEELNDLYKNKNSMVTVVDKHGKPCCAVRMLDVFETKFGNPDPRLVVGEGFGEDVQAYQAAHRKVWEDLAESGKLKLGDDTILVVELFELVNEREEDVP